MPADIFVPRMYIPFASVPAPGLVPRTLNHFTTVSEVVIFTRLSESYDRPV